MTYKVLSGTLSLYTTTTVSVLTLMFICVFIHAAEMQYLAVIFSYVILWIFVIHLM